jgi:primosomal protein N'
MLKYQIIETCLKCGHKWIRRTFKPKRCPSCDSTVWATFSGKRNPERSLKIEVLPGQSMVYKFDKSTMRAIKKAQKENPRLKVTARADGVLVENVLL